jgi:hypothetical protein
LNRENFTDSKDTIRFLKIKFSIYISLLNILLFLGIAPVLPPTSPVKQTRNRPIEKKVTRNTQTKNQYPIEAKTLESTLRNLNLSTKPTRPRLSVSQCGSITSRDSSLPRTPYPKRDFSTSNCPFYEPERVLGPNLACKKSSPNYTIGTRTRETSAEKPIRQQNLTPGPIYDILNALDSIKIKSPAFTFGSKVCTKSRLNEEKRHPSM